MDRIKVVEILEATTGGTRRHLFDLATHLDPARFSVSVIASTRRGDPGFLDDVHAMERRGISVTLVPMERRIAPARDLLALLRLRRELRRAHADVVHTHSSKAGVLGRVAARWCGVPAVIHTPHVFPFQMDVGTARARLYARIERLAAGFTDAIICVCRDEKRIAEAWRVAPAGKLAVIENGIESPAVRRGGSHDARAALGAGPEDLLVGSVGRFTPQKGYADLLRAARLVIDRVPRARFVLAGDGDMRRDLERLAGKLSLGPHLSMLGTMEDLSSFYAAIDVFTLTSLWEGLPYALLEAMAAGKPIVATGVGGVADAVSHGGNGYVVPPREVTALADALVDLLEHRARREQFGAASAGRMSQRYRLKDMISQTADLYEHTLDARRQKR